MEFKPGDCGLCTSTSIGKSFTKGTIYLYRLNVYSHTGTFTTIDNQGIPNGFSKDNFINLGPVITDLEYILYNIDNNKD